MVLPVKRLLLCNMHIRFKVQPSICSNICALEIARVSWESRPSARVAGLGAHTSGTVQHWLAIDVSCLAASRSQVTTIDQETAEVSKATEPLRTLGKYRSGRLLGWNADTKWRGLVFFGESYRHPSPELR